MSNTTWVAYSSRSLTQKSHIFTHEFAEEVGVEKDVTTFDTRIGVKMTRFYPKNLPRELACLDPHQHDDQETC